VRHSVLAAETRRDETRRRKTFGYKAMKDELSMPILHARNLVIIKRPYRRTSLAHQSASSTPRRGCGTASSGACTRAPWMIARANACMTLCGSHRNGANAFATDAFAGWLKRCGAPLQNPTIPCAVEQDIIAARSNARERASRLNTYRTLPALYTT
jgi:hypothetical protein